MRKWPKFIKHEINFAISDCRIYDNRIYYKNRLLIPADDEFKMQIVYRTHSSGPAGHPGKEKENYRANRKIVFLATNNPGHSGLR
jgi:hypothetical protein